MVKKITNQLYKVNAYACSTMIVEVDDIYDDNVMELRKKLELDSVGHKLNLLAYLAELTSNGCIILSVTEFNVDGSKPKVAYAKEKDFKKILKHYLDERRK